MRSKQILDLPMQENDARAATIRDYLKALLSKLWKEDEGFSGKRPFGNSGWKYDVLAALVAGGALPGALDEDGCVGDVDEAAGDVLIQSAIASLN